MRIIGDGDASFKSDKKVIGGIILMLANKEMTKASTIYLKAKQIEYHPEVVVHPPREMNKTLSQNSNIGKNKIRFMCRVQYSLILNQKF